jgi:hypothetical protein
MKCPRCKKQELEKPKLMNKLSRRDNRTYICDLCGTEEALFDWSIQNYSETERKLKLTADASWLPPKVLESRWYYLPPQVSEVLQGVLSTAKK